MCHCIALRWGVNQVGKFHYWALLTPSWDHFSGTEDALGKGSIRGLRVEETAKMALSCILFFCKILGKGPIFV